MAKTFAGDYLLAIRATSPLSGIERIAPFSWLPGMRLCWQTMIIFQKQSPCCALQVFRARTGKIEMPRRLAATIMLDVLTDGQMREI